MSHRPRRKGHNLDDVDDHEDVPLSLEVERGHDLTLWVCTGCHKISSTEFVQIQSVVHDLRIEKR